MYYQNDYSPSRQQPPIPNWYDLAPTHIQQRYFPRAISTPERTYIDYQTPIRQQSPPRYDYYDYNDQYSHPRTYYQYDDYQEQQYQEPEQCQQREYFNTYSSYKNDLKQYDKVHNVYYNIQINEQIPSVTMIKPTNIDTIQDQRNFQNFKDDLYNSNYYTYSQMIEHTLACLKEQVYFDREIEAIKRRLNDSDDLNLETLFKIFTDDEKFIQKDELYEIFNKWELNPKFSDIELLLKSYGKGYSDQLKMTQEELRCLFKIEGEKSRKEISQQTLMLIKRLFKMLLNCESSFEYMRQKLHKKLTNFTYVFDYLDKQHKGFLTDMDLRQNFSEKNFLINVKDAKLLIERFDKNYDNVIDLQEFVRELQPKSKAKYIED